MTNLSKIQITSISKSSSKEIANKIEVVLLRLILLLVLILNLTLIYPKYILVSNTIVVYENLEWNTNTHTALNLYRPYGCLSGCLVGFNV